MNTKTIILVVVLSTLVGGGISFLIKNNGTKKTAFIDYNKLYNDFDYKKELEKQLESVTLSRNNILDSMQLQLKIMYSKLQAQKNPSKEEMIRFEDFRKEYSIKKEQFEQDNNATTQDYVQKITGQMNQYVQDFGKKNAYDYIYGANGNGAVMYANDENDITEQVLKYINEKYHGK